jgi:hypothetical protein
VKKDNWFLITAGFSPEDMVSAAKRVEYQAKSLYSFRRIIRISKENIASYCPQLTQKYPDKVSDSNPGYGYAAWKTEVVFNALKGDFGVCDGVVWVDGGCEINSTLFTRTKFKRTLERAVDYGHAVFALHTQESKYTKKAVFDLFPTAIEIQPDVQFQATYFILHGQTGLKIAESIFTKILNDFDIVDPTKLSSQENVSLDLPKCEQSLLSLAVKSEQKINTMKTPPAGNRGWKSLLRALGEPIWVSRNRTGESLIPSIFRLIP